MCPNDPECGAIVSLYCACRSWPAARRSVRSSITATQPLVFEAAESRRQVSVAPIIGRHTAGAMFSLNFGR